jgi:hypothetical protein
LRSAIEEGELHDLQLSPWVKIPGTHWIRDLLVLQSLSGRCKLPLSIKFRDCNCKKRTLLMPVKIKHLAKPRY